MMHPDDPRRAEAQAMPIADIVARLDLQGLQRAGHEMVGPCPQCGGRDRFGINLTKRVFQCRKCGGTGGNIDLVMFVMGLDFPAALDWLCGSVEGISPEERREKILSAFRALETRNAREDFTGTGQPAVKAVEKLSGVDTDRTEVMALWDEYKTGE